MMNNSPLLQWNAEAEILFAQENLKKEGGETCET